MCHSVRVSFRYDSSDMSAVVFSIDDKPSIIDDHIGVRRLSTKSYSKFPVGKPQGFGTQWRWYWKDDIGQWQPYETDELQYTLERKYLDGQKTYLFTREKLHFKQLNLETSKDRQIARKPNSFVPQSDVINCCFPDGLNLPTAPPRPPGWAEWDCAHDFELVEIDSSADEFKTLVDMMCETINRSKLNVETVYRIQNKKLWRAYDAKKKNMQEDGKKDGSNENEKTLFHGTDSFNTCKGICTNNFDFRLSGKNGTVYGEGAYFAKEAKYSNSYTGNGESDKRYMFLAKVLVGSYTKGNSSYKRPPGTGVGSKLYDTCVDNESDPKIFVVFELNQCYPLYLVVYQYNSGIRTRPSSIQPTANIRPSTRPSGFPSPSSQTSISSATRSTSNVLGQSSSSSHTGSSTGSVYSSPPQMQPLSYPSSQTSTRVISPVRSSSSSGARWSSDQDDYRNLAYPRSNSGSNINKSSPEKTCVIQ
ncbi:hypothetical protein KUTeg_001730 [Tegillarca granosa]|uniref:Poly [ADP-ribose] polymerase n=1 Tax=Tegillarca granosa TaxID=220873 RepID=A0ABQ9FWP7_TEGGR|nr:hypothetical protein KUTeg_001730 [Tegillarca granosa]